MNFRHAGYYLTLRGFETKEVDRLQTFLTPPYHSTNLLRKINFGVILRDVSHSESIISMTINFYQYELNVNLLFCQFKSQS